MEGMVTNRVLVHGPFCGGLVTNEIQFIKTRPCGRISFSFVDLITVLMCCDLVGGCGCAPNDTDTNHAAVMVGQVTFFYDLHKRKLENH